MAGLSDILETTQLEKVAGGFVFTEGPLWHPDGFYYFVDIRQNMLYRMVLGQKAEVVRKTIGGNGTTFDLQGRLVQCEGDGRMVTRLEANGAVTTLADRFEGKKLNRPNDVICHSNGSLYFTDPAYRVPMAERELDAAGVPPRARWGRGQPGGAGRVSERSCAVTGRTDALHREHAGAGARHIHAVELDAAGNMVRFPAAAGKPADMSAGWHEWCARRHEGGRGRAGILHRHRHGCVGVRAGRLPGKIGIIEMPEVLRQELRLRRTGPAHPVPDRQHVRIYAADQDAGYGASVVQDAQRQVARSVIARRRIRRSKLGQSLRSRRDRDCFVAMLLAMTMPCSHPRTPAPAP